MRVQGLLASLAMVAALAAGGWACSNTTGGHGGSSSPESQEDCEEGETFHPVAEVCVEDQTDSNDFNQSTDNDGGENSQSNNDGGSNQIEECGPGALKGQACRPDGAPLPSAQITVEGEDCEDGEPFEMSVNADEDGMYQLDGIPAGEHTLEIRSGSFETSQPLYISKGETTDLEQEAAKVCIGDAAVDIAVLQGGLDDVVSILNTIGVSFDVVGADDGADVPGGGVDSAIGFLTDLDEMLGYDILFIECGDLWTQLETSPGVDINLVINNIREFVESGGSLYASDWAHPFIQNALPEAIEFYGDDPDSPSAARVGDSYDSFSPLEAEVVDDEVAGVLGTDEVDLELMILWAVAADAGDHSEVYFKGDPMITDNGMSTTIYDAPLMISYEDPGTVQGRAIFTSFHNQDQAASVIEEIMEYVIFQL